HGNTAFESKPGAAVSAVSEIHPKARAGDPEVEEVHERNKKRKMESRGLPTGPVPGTKFGTRGHRMKDKQALEQGRQVVSHYMPGCMPLR
nr:hypothetical protein [Tanacetum cinerariifolium]